MSYLADGWQRGVQRAATYAFISEPSESGFEEAALIKPDNHTIAPGGVVIGVHLDFAVLPLGTAFCYFGAGNALPVAIIWLELNQKSRHVRFCLHGQPSDMLR